MRRLIRLLTPEGIIAIGIILFVALVFVAFEVSDRGAREIQPVTVLPAPEIMAAEIMEEWDTWGCLYRVSDPDWIDHQITWWWDKKKKDPNVRKEKINNTLAIWG